MNLSQETINKIVEVSIPFIGFRGSMKTVANCTNNYNKYRRFINCINYKDKKIILCTLINFVQTGRHDESQNFNFCSDEDAIGFLEIISEHLVVNGQFSELLKVMPKSLTRGKRIRDMIIKYIKLSYSCKEFFIGLQQTHKVIKYVNEFKSIINGLDHEKKSELLALMMYGDTDCLWSDVVNKAKEIVDNDFAEKMILTENIPGKLQCGYKKYLENQN